MEGTGGKALAADHRESIHSTIAIDFWITSHELKPLLTDMASHIGEAARYNLDEMEYTITVNPPGTLLFIDFEEVFNLNFMFICLEIFGFSHCLIRWVKTLY